MRLIVLPMIALGLTAAAPPAQLSAPQDPDVPRYHRGMYLMDSLAMADVIVLGVPRAPKGGVPSPKIAPESVPSQPPPKREPPATLEVAKILFGTLGDDLQPGKDVIRLVGPYRCKWDSPGLWLLLWTPQGYFVLNPEPDRLPA